MTRSAMLMLAGKGERLLPFTATRAKPLLPVLGIPIAQYAVSHLRAYGVTRIVGNLHHLADQTESELMGLNWGGCTWIPSDERPRLLGSAGGVRHALKALGGEAFFVVNGDVIFPVDLAALEETHRHLKQSRGVQLTLSVLPCSPAGEVYRRVEWDRRSGCLSGLGEKESGVPYFAGTYLAEPEVFESLPDGVPTDFVADVLTPAMKAGKVGVYLANAPWYDIGRPELWRDAHLNIQEQVDHGRMILPQFGIEKQEEFRILKDLGTVEYAPFPKVTKRNAIWYQGIWGAV